MHFYAIYFIKLVILIFQPHTKLENFHRPTSLFKHHVNANASRSIYLSTYPLPILVYMSRFEKLRGESGVKFCIFYLQFHHQSDNSNVQGQASLLEADKRHRPRLQV